MRNRNRNSLLFLFIFYIVVSPIKIVIVIELTNLTELFITHNSLLITHYSLLITHYSLLMLSTFHHNCYIVILLYCYIVISRCHIIYIIFASLLPLTICFPFVFSHYSHNFYIIIEIEMFIK